MVKLKYMILGAWTGLAAWIRHGLRQLNFIASGVIDKTWGLGSCVQFGMSFVFVLVESSPWGHPVDLSYGAIWPPACELPTVHWVISTCHMLLWETCLLIAPQLIHDPHSTCYTCMHVLYFKLWCYDLIMILYISLILESQVIAYSYG